MHSSSSSSSDKKSFHTPADSKSSSYHTPRGTPIPVAPRRTRLTQQMILEAFNERRPWQTPDTKWMLGRDHATFIVDFMRKNPGLGGAGWSLHFGKIPWPPSRGRTLENHDFSDVLNGLRDILDPDTRQARTDLLLRRLFGTADVLWDESRAGPAEEALRLFTGKCNTVRPGATKKKKRKKKKTKGNTKKKRRGRRTRKK